MAHALTEVHTFTSTVTVPDPTDNRSNAAEVVTAFVQALANRTRFLKDTTDVAAKLNVPNTFTATNTFATVNVTTLNASGAVNSDSVDTGALEASSIVSTHDVHANNSLTGTHVTVTATAAAAALSLSGDATIGGDVKLSNAKRYKYNPVRSSTKAIKLGNACVNGASAFGLFTPSKWIASGGDVNLTFPIELPQGAVIQSFKIQHLQTAVANPINFSKRTLNWTVNGVAQTITSITSVSDGLSPSNINTPVSGAATAVDNTTSEYWVNITLRDGNELYGVQVTFDDPGPRND